MSRILFSLVLLTTSRFLSAIQLPPPVLEDKSLRAALSPFIDTDWSALQRAGVDIGVTHAISEGFEWGIDVSSNALSANLFRSADTIPVVSGGVMLRFLRDLTGTWFSGGQFDISYAHPYRNPQTDQYGELRVSGSIPTTIKLSDAISLSFSPGVLFGAKNEEDVQKNRLWGSEFGVKLPLWFIYRLNVTTLFAEVNPQIASWTHLLSSFRTQVNVGLAFDL